MFSLKKFLVSVWFNSVCFVRKVGNQGYVLRKCIYWKVFEQMSIGKAYLHVFLMKMREIDAAGVVYLEPF